MRHLVPLIVLLAVPGLLRAQDVGTCAPATADAYLEGRDVRARILNDGGLFWRGGPRVYEVPKGAGVPSVFAASLWVGGLVGDSLRTAASIYGPWEFWPGPLPEDGSAPTDCTPYDRLWRVSRGDVSAYEHHGYLADDLRDWPVHLGAPVLDGDGIPGNYDLAAGDRPAILGDESVWWVMNDQGGVHSRTGTAPIGLEARVMAYAFDEPGVFGKATFYRYRLTYRGDVPLDSAYVGLFLNTDLGGFDDDYIGSDTTLHLGYTYNADDDDTGHPGSAPPAFGVAVLQGPRAFPNGRDDDHDGEADESGERYGMTTFSYYVHGGGPSRGDPYGAVAFMNYLRGYWADGQPLTIGGEGREFSDARTRFAYPGDPVTGAFWSERNVDGRGRTNYPSDRRMVVATGPFSMQPGETEEVVFGLVWSRGRDHLDSVRQLREDVAHVRSLREVLLAPRLSAPPAQAPPRVELAFDVYPSPVVEQAVARYSVPHAMPVRLTLYDALGREVAVLADGAHAAGDHRAEVDVRGLARGTYFVRMVLYGTAFTRALVVTR